MRSIHALTLRASWLGGPARLVSLARLAPLFACAGVLTTSLPAAGQAEPAPAPQAPPAAPEAPPAAAEASPPAAEASPPAAEASPPAAEAAPVAPEGSAAAAAVAPDGSAEPLPEDLEVYDPNEEIAEVVVTSFRSSLAAALEKKQNSTAQIDAIVAEDMADFPDLNLAESLQRIPGVAITRTNGEGAQITVRGLAGQYTRVRVNGMETRANIGNTYQNNGGRGFDFNLFASELFNSIVVHKTASAELDEGSLGAVVDLNTARAFNYEKGFTFVAGATAAYNDLEDTVRPRLTGLLSYRDPGGIWGATASVAYNRVRLDVVSTDTVNWQKAPFGSVEGVSCAAVDGVPTMDPGCLEVNDAFHPRIPRFGQDVVTGDRIGLTAGFQLRPTALTEIRLDGLYANYPTRTEQRRLFPLIRNNEGSAAISGYTLRAFPDRFGTGNDSLIAANVDNAQVRSEHVRLDSVAEFYQIGLGIDQRISDSFRIDAFAGTQRSKAGLPHDTTVNYDNRAYNGYRFDFTNDETPYLAFGGPDVTDPANFVVPELRDRVGSVEGGFDTAELNLHYDIVEQLKLAAGANYKRATYKTEMSTRDGTVCGLGLYECSDTDGDGENDIIGPPGDPALTEQFEYGGEVGAGSTTRWASPSVDGWVDYFDYYNAPLTINQGGTNEVTEKNLGFFLQAKGEIQLGVGEMRLLYDAGMRFVETRQQSKGYAGGAYVTVDRDPYHDWLPSANTALWLTNELVLRLAAARVMARPALGDLSPGAAVDSFAYNINFQNPELDPTRATTLDAAIEWYFGEGALLALAPFFKNIDSFPIRATQRGFYADTGLPADAILPTSPASMTPGGEGNCGDPAGCWQISQLSNGPGSKLKGFEVALQVPWNTLYGALPVVLRDMGVLANYTYADSKADYQYFGNPVSERLIGLSNHSVNGTLYYDDSRFDARLSAAYRSDFLIGGPNSQGNLWAYNEADLRFDFSSSYNVNEHLKISFEALNFTNAPFAQKVDVDAERRLMYNKNGRTFLLGARVTY